MIALEGSATAPSARASLWVGRWDPGPEEEERAFRPSSRISYLLLARWWRCRMVGEEGALIAVGLEVARSG